MPTANSLLWFSTLWKYIIVGQPAIFASTTYRQIRDEHVLVEYLLCSHFFFFDAMNQTGLLSLCFHLIKAATNCLLTCMPSDTFNSY